ncbi:MAG: hypothetical protein R3F61_04790 [Myxococcota bacterium]
MVFDRSVLAGFVIERCASERVAVWRVDLHERHLEQGARIADPESRVRHPPRPDQQVAVPPGGRDAEPRASD